MGFDRIEFRLKNMMKIGYRDPQTTITCHSTGPAECIRKGAEFSDFLRKQKTYGKGQTGPVRRGIGIAFSVTRPVCIRSVWRPAHVAWSSTGRFDPAADGATEIGQAADTVFRADGAEELGFSFKPRPFPQHAGYRRHPFRYRRLRLRQTYVSGTGGQETARKMKSEILAYASTMIHKDPGDLDIEDDMVVHVGSREPLIAAVSKVAMEACYSLTN